MGRSSNTTAFAISSAAASKSSVGDCRSMSIVEVTAPNKGPGLGSASLNECLGQNVLTAVLLK